jgi:surfactin synthase thioesterase subunit
MELICFPHAGGSASFYFPLSQVLSPAVELLALQYPGRQDRRTEKCVDNVSELADRILDVLAVRQERPFALFGHSMGGVLAFEVAQRLIHKAGRKPLWFFSSSRRAPSTHRDSAIHLRDDAGVVEELRLLAGAEAGWLADKELLASFLPAIRSDYKAIETYRYQPAPPLDCPITAFMGDADPYTTVDEAEKWRDHTTSGFDLHVFGGGHFYLDAHRNEVAQTIGSALTSALSVESIDGRAH